MKTSHAATAAVSLLLIVVETILGGSEHAATVVLNVASVAVVALAAGFAAVAARGGTGRVRAAWAVMALGLAAAAVAETLWAARSFGFITFGFPGIADAFYLMFPLATLAALLLFPPARDRTLQGRLLLDGVIIAASMLIVAWVTALRPAYESGSATRIQAVVSMAYPLADVLVFTVAAVALARSRAGERLMLTLIAAGMFAATLAESLFAYLSVGTGPFSGHHVVETTWLAGMLLIMLAAVEGRRCRFDRESDSYPGWASVWLPYAPVMLAVAVMATQPYAAAGQPVVLTAGIVLLAAVLVRQFLAVADNRRLMAHATHQAQSDPLTGLANRTVFKTHLAQVIPQTGIGGRSVAVLLLDLDDFKLVNDSLGHGSGDDVLVAVADRLCALVGEDGLVSRLGGDEFAVLMTATGEEIAAAADRLLAAFDVPVQVDGHPLDVRATLGVAVAAGSGVTARDLVSQADAAMYAGKRAKRGGARTDDIDAVGSPATVASSLQRVAELRSAVERGELALVYQPKVDLRTGRVTGAEALLRWPHPVRGMLKPGQFLTLIRRHGLIDDVTDLVLRRALDDVARWRGEGADIPVAVNLFAPSLSNPGFPARVDGALAVRGLPGAALTLEITEGLPLGSTGEIGPVLTELRRTGVRIAVDDFASGYSTIADLCRLPVDEIKIDADFIAALHSDPRVAAVVRAVTSLSAELGLVSVAEGVTDARTARLLRGYGCEQGQGEYFSAPIGAAEIPGFARRAASAATSGQPTASGMPVAP